MSATERFYVAGPMRGIPYFNFPLFNLVTNVLRESGHMVFNPAERDTQRHGGANITNPTGDEKQAERDHGFDLRQALADDLEFICTQATGVVTLPGWEKSKGATAEVATARALGLPVLTVAEALAL